MVAGRPSAASQMPTIPGERIAPPEDLGEFEKAEWLAIVAGLPPGWIQVEHVPIMRQLCRHTKVAHHYSVVLARLLELSVEWTPDDERWRQVALISRVHGIETDHIINCSKMLRLTKLADRPERASVKVKRGSAVAVKPWADWGHAEPGKPVIAPS